MGVCESQLKTRRKESVESWQKGRIGIEKESDFVDYGEDVEMALLEFLHDIEEGSVNLISNFRFHLVEVSQSIVKCEFRVGRRGLTGARRNGSRWEYDRHEPNPLLSLPVNTPFDMFERKW